MWAERAEGTNSALRGRRKWRTRRRRFWRNFAASLQYEDLPEQVRESCKNLLLDALACAVAGRHGDETEQVAALAGALAQSRESSVIGGDRLSLAGATHAQRLPDHRRHHVRHPSLDADPRHARGDAAGAGDRRARRRVRPRPPGRARRRHGGDDADRHRHSTIRCSAPGAGTAPACSGRSAPPRRSAGLRALRRRDHGEGVRPRRQPVRRHLRGVGHADGEIPPVPRRAVRPDGGAARRAEIPCRPRNSSPPRTAASTTPMPTAESRRSPSPISASAGSSSRSRCGCGRRRRRRRRMNTALFDLVEQARARLRQDARRCACR